MVKVLLALAMAITMQTDVDILFGQGMNAFNKGSYQEALGLFSTALDIDTVNQNIRFNRATTYMKLRMFDEAMTDLNRIVLDAGDVPMVLVQRAVVYAELGRPDLGIVDLTTAIAKDSVFPKAHLLRGKLRMQAGGQDAESLACADFKVALQNGDPSAKRLMPPSCR